MRIWGVEKNRFLRLVFFLCAAVLISGCGKKVIGPSSAGTVSSGSTAVKRSVVRVARAQIGKPYKWGGASPKEGFDCSGLVWWVYRRHGIDVPRVSWQQKNAGKPVHRSRIQAGDIVLFRIPGGGKSLHTGIYSGNGHSFIHSPKSGHHVREESMEKNYWRKYYIGARRVIK
ncbi:C40 family peptidase [Desulfovibrio sp. JC010]|uniref:C40 family peptidase n=1 Tax=Desulfovibrio sp. JC010 TaxID=2593641 RepID=UPI001EF2C01A|nr:C40 family peptidase [Desulfovibrio sp. JC010]